MNHRMYELFEARMKSAHKSLSKPRQLVFKTLIAEEQPISMSELFHKLEPGLDRASLYRTIKLFENLDIVHRIHIGWKYKLELTEKFLAHHHHIVCVRCGKIVDVKETKAFEDDLHQLAIAAGFTHENHSLEIQGVCSDCAKK